MMVCSEPTTRTVCSAEKSKTKTNLTTAGCATKAPERGALLIRPNVRYLSWIFLRWEKSLRNWNCFRSSVCRTFAVVHPDKNGETIKTGGLKIRPRVVIHAYASLVRLYCSQTKDTVCACVCVCMCDCPVRSDGLYSVG